MLNEIFIIVCAMIFAFFVGWKMGLNDGKKTERKDLIRKGVLKEDDIKK